MKKTLGLLAIILVFIAGYFYFNKPQPLVCKGAQGLTIVRISDDALELRGQIIFHNPNKMRARLGKVDMEVKLNDNVAGTIHDEFKEAVKGGEDFPFSFQVRFPRGYVLRDSVSVRDVPLSIIGSASSDALFADYTFPITYTGTVRNDF